MRALPLLLLATLLVGSLPHAASEAPDALERALSYVASRQTASGDWLPPPGSGQGISASYVVEAVAAAGLDAKRWPSREKSAFAALGPETCGHPSPADERDCVYKKLMRRAHSASGAGYDASTMREGDLVAATRAGFVGGQFGDPTYVNDDIWAILTLRAAGVPASDAMIRAGVQNILQTRTPDGGWAYRSLSTAGDTDVTGMALAALAAGGHDLSTETRARDFLLSRWRAGGGFANPPMDVNCQSTVWAVHGLAALGRERNTTALDHLRSLQKPDGSIDHDLWCTVEAVVVLAGERFPFTPHARVVPPSPTAYALEAVELRAPSATRAVWSFDDEEIEGASVTKTFATAGDHAYSLFARTSEGQGRAEGVVRVLSARPRVGTLPAEVAIARHTPLSLDLGNASDPDGRVVAFEIDWADGTVGAATNHSYARAGTYVVSVRVQDDAGVWSHPATMRVIVTNRAPIPAPLPERIAADRARGFTLAANATDPDGDTVRVRWTYGGASGEGLARQVPTTLGNATLSLVYDDGEGGFAWRNVTIETSNLPPSLDLDPFPEARAEEEILLRASASDADGPEPRVLWTIGTQTIEGLAARVRLPAGAHHVQVRATDADGASVASSATLIVAPLDAPPQAPAEAPEIRALSAELAEGALRVAFLTTPGARATLRWSWEGGAGEWTDAQSPATIPLAHARRASVTLLVERDGLVATRETGVLQAATPDALEAPRATVTPDAPVVVRAQEEAPGEDETPATPHRSEDPLEPAALIAQGASRPTPSPLWLALGALLLGTLRKRAR